jgi:hypothetical protein
MQGPGPRSWGSLKCDSEIWFELCGTWTPEWLLWQGPEAIVQVNYRPILSSKKVPHIKKPAVIRQKTKIWQWAPDGSPTPRQTGRLTIGHKLTSTSRRQIWPLIREGAPQRQYSNFQTENNIWSQVPEWTWHQDILTDWPSVVTWLWLFEVSQCVWIRKLKSVHRRVGPPSVSRVEVQGSGS